MSCLHSSLFVFIAGISTLSRLYAWSLFVAGLVGHSGNTFSRDWVQIVVLPYISLEFFLLDIGKQSSSRCDAAKRGVPSGIILFATRISLKYDIK